MPKDTKKYAARKQAQERREAARQRVAQRREAAKETERRKRLKRQRRKQKKRHQSVVILWSIILILFLWVLVGAALHLVPMLRERWADWQAATPDWVDVQIIDINGVARRGEKLDGVNDIVVHYVGNPGTTAQENRDYFNDPDTEVSAHFVVGLEGEVIQCIPLDEKSSASNERNHDTISIEVCHPNADGAFTETTYDSLVKLTAWLCKRYDLSTDHVIRHYDITGKECPLYFVRHTDAWEQFLTDVENTI